MSSKRIYQFAKELKIESNALVAVCDELQLAKRSALASLSEEEMEQIRAHLKQKSRGSRGSSTAGTKAPAAGEDRSAISREDYIAPAGTTKTEPIPVLPVRKSTRSPAKSTEPKTKQPEPPTEPPQEAPDRSEAEAVEEAPEQYEPVTEGSEAGEFAEVAATDETTEEEFAAEEVIAEDEATEPAVTAEAESETATAEEEEKEEPPEEPEEQESPYAEAPAAELPPVPPVDPKAPVRPLDKQGEKSGEKPSGRDRGRAKPKTPRLFKLAPVPKAKMPTPSKKEEPPAQKPEIRLTPGSIKASKSGEKPLAEHMRQKEAKRKRGRPAEEKEPGKQTAEGGVPLLPRQRGRRGKAGKSEAEVEKEERAAKRQRGVRRGRFREVEDDLGTSTPVRQTRLRRTGRTSTAEPRKGSVVLELPCTVRAFTEALGLPANQVLGKLLSMGTMANINSILDVETAELLAMELGVEVSFRQQTDPEEKLSALWDSLDEEENLQPRPPIITLLGHVDHGKTSLLDRILSSNVVAGEKGGITQHIRAYRIEKDGRAVAFVDTPGHEAFTAMRARGANVTDIVILVVAADDGVMPQTEEAINHARAAGVPLVVALNKVDLPGVHPEQTLQQLAAHELLPSEWGGNTEVIRTSAITGEGIDELLETVLTLAELYELKADAKRAACGTCLEAEVQPGRGVVSKVLVQKGTLKVGDVVVCGPAHGRVKAMYDTLLPNRQLEEAGPSTPVDLIGLDDVPDAGDRFYVLDNVAEARKIAEARAEQLRERAIADSRPPVTLENLFERLSEDEIQTLNIILRADVRGSLEAILKEVDKLEHPEVQIKVLQAMVGGITEADVHLAHASDAVIMGFNVVPDEKAKQLAEQLKVQIRRYDIIYQLTDDLRAALEGMLKPEEREVDVGRALVQRLFHISRLGTIAGCRVLAGIIPRDARLRVIRDNRVIGTYDIDSLRREKDDIREVREGLECGIRLRGFNDVKEGDILEAVRVEEVQRSLD